MRAINNITRGVCQVGINAWKVASMPKALRDKFLFLWTGGYSGNDLKDRLGSSAVISVTGKDWTTRYIPQNTSATFSVPDNATFLSADGDNFWFDTLDVRQQKTHADLIASTTMRTFVKYADFEPYNIYAIGILKAGEIITDADKITLNKFFKLWAEYWGELMDSGYMKDNRGGDSLHPELETYLTGLATPLSTTQVSKLNQFITSLKTGFGITSLSEVFDIMYLMAGETLESSMRNIVKDAHHLTLINSPLWTQFEGFKGNGSSMAISTNYDPGTNGVNVSRDSLAIGIYARTTTIGAYVISGVVDNNSNEISITPRLNYDTVGRMYIRINQKTYTYKPSSGDVKGMLIASRTAPNSIGGYLNGVDLNFTGSSEPSTGLSTGYNLFFLCASIRNTRSSYSPDQIAFAFVSRGLNLADTSLITQAVEAYMDSNGKGVIS